MAETLAGHTKAAPVELTRAVEVAAYAVFGVLSLWWVRQFGFAPTLTDGELYRGAGQAIIEGRDPWAASAAGWHFGSFPPTVLLFAPFGLLPPAVFAAVWLALTLAAAVYIVRALDLAWAWLAYPPMVFAVLLGNPIVVSMALVLAGRSSLGVLGAVMRPQMTLVVIVRDPRTTIPLALVVLASLVVMPYWIGEAGQIAARYAVESGASVNAWGSLWMIPVGLAMVALARRDLTIAAWLAPMALGPAAGWYSAMALMVTRSPWQAALGAVPIPGAMALAGSVEAIRREAAPAGSVTAP